MSELKEIFSEIGQTLDSMTLSCPLESLPKNCRHALKNLAKKLAKAEEKALEKERRYNLMDDLYYSIGSKLNSTFEQDEILSIILDSLKRLIGFDAAGIFLVDKTNNNITAELIIGYQESKLNRVYQKVGEGILGWVIQNGEIVNLPDVRKDSRYIDARNRTRSECAVPMISEGRVIGCINLESNNLDAFSQDDVHLLETYATQATLAVERARIQSQLWEKKRLEKEIEIARNIHSALLPRNAPDIKDFQVSGFNVSSFEVGGDYYDFIPLPIGGYGLAIADVAGKGLGAALIMSGFRAALRSEVRHNFQPHQVMHKVNHFVVESTDPGSFVTAVYGTLIANEFNYVNAGHNPPVLLHPNGSFELLETGGLILGFKTEQYYEQAKVLLKSGDSILFYTDGLTEAMNQNSEEFGIERLIKAFKSSQKLPFKDRINFIHQKTVRFSKSSGLMDDQTLMILSCR